MSNFDLDSAISLIVDDCRESNYRDCLLRSIEFFDENPIIPDLKDEVQKVMDNYEKMLECYASDVKDPKLPEVYAGIKSFCHNLVHHLLMYQVIQNDSFFRSASDSSKNLDLMQIGERIEKGDIDEDFLNLAFSYILTVRQWNGKKLSYFADIVCNPATDYRAAALMISAAMLSSIKVFDYNMMTTLFDIWKKSKDVKVSERALVGWSVIMMSVDSEQYPYIKEFIDKIKEDEKTVAHLFAVQKQILFCMDAADDAQQFSNDVMSAFPDDKWLKPLADDEKPSVDDILAPDMKEKMMATIDKKINKMVNMQRQGADVYFDGFSKMKTFDFFNVASNWFLPYYGSHSSLAPLLEVLDGDETFARSMEKSFSFSDGDKYSFCFVMASSLSGILSALKPVVKEGFSPLLDNPIVDNPDEMAFLQRRICLQDLYRFLTLSPFKNSFPELFSTEEGSYAYFLANPLFKEDKCFDDARILVSNFLFSREHFEQLDYFLLDHPYRKDEKLMKGFCSMSHSDYVGAIELLSPFQNDKDSARLVKRSLMDCYIGLNNFDKALELCEELEREKATKSLFVKKAYCLFQTHRIDDAMALLYEADYKNPNDLDILRPLAWGHILRREFDKALALYNQIVELAPSENSEDAYNIGVCFWLKGSFYSSMPFFYRYMEKTEDDVDELIKKIHVDLNMLKETGLQEFELVLLRDIITRWSPDVMNDSDEKDDPDGMDAMDDMDD